MNKIPLCELLWSVDGKNILYDQFGSCNTPNLQCRNKNTFRKERIKTLALQNEKCCQQIIRCI